MINILPSSEKNGLHHSTQLTKRINRTDQLFSFATVWRLFRLRMVLPLSFFRAENDKLVSNL
jgi:hypothetical protein